MATLASMLVFLVSAAWCAERLVRSSRAIWALLPVPTLIVSWVALLALRGTPTPGRALLAFGVADLAVLAISTLAVLRLLGGFEQWGESPADDGDDDGREPDGPPLTPHPRGPRRVQPARRPRRSGSGNGSGSTRPRRPAHASARDHVAPRDR